MMENEPYSPEQIRHLKEVTDAWRDHAPLLLERYDLVGGLQWKTVAGNEYLYRYHPDPITKKKKSTSMGRRSPETEAAFAQFNVRREAVSHALAAGEAALESQMRVTKALRLGRVPVELASVFRVLWSAQVSDHLMLVSDHSVYGYETVFLSKIDAGLTADLQFCAMSDGLLEEIFPALGRAILASDKTAEIQVVGREVRVSGRFGSISFTSPSNLVARWAHQIDATDKQAQTLLDLLSWEPLPALTLSRSGEPAPVQVPDPRAFAFMKAPKDGPSAELGSAIAVLAAETEQYQFPDDVLDVMPSLTEALGHRRFGATI
ncbi:hypothetical protein ABIB57_001100 [Devosia sp. UYZn731]|uniref:hypothetical protein n=1 Tax=Devosia sp. UYZn731 TaxID=3156345 RepID=UPI003391C76B